MDIESMPSQEEVERATGVPFGDLRSELLGELGFVPGTAPEPLGP